MGSDVYGLPSRETYPDSQTYVLTVQRYEVILKVPNILGLFLFNKTTFLAKFFIFCEKTLWNR